MTSPRADWIPKAVYGALLTIIMSLLGWMALSMSEVKADMRVLREQFATIKERTERTFSLEPRLARVEASYMTIAEGSKIHEEIKVIRARLPECYPPPETRERLKEYDKKLEKIMERLREVETRERRE